MDVASQEQINQRLQEAKDTVQNMAEEDEKLSAAS